MFCSNCGQERISTETSFCSRCGFLLTAVGDLLKAGGQNPYAVTSASKTQSPRKRGLKQGVFLFLMTFLVAPLMGMITMALNIEPFLVGIGVVVCFIGGILRMVYALMFESMDPGVPTLEEKVMAGAMLSKPRRRLLKPFRRSNMSRRQIILLRQVETGVIPTTSSR